MTKIHTLSALALFTAVSAPVSADNIYVQFTGATPAITGNSTVKGFNGAVEALAWSWGGNRAYSSGAGGGGPQLSSLNIGEISFVKYSDIATTPILINLNGPLMNEAVISLTDDSGVLYQTIKLDKPAIIGYQSGVRVGANGRSTETIEIGFSGVRVEDPQGGTPSFEYCLETKTANYPCP